MTIITLILLDFASFLAHGLWQMSYLPDVLKRSLNAHLHTHCACTPSPRTLQGGSEEPLIIDFPSYFFCLLQWISYLQHIACCGLHTHPVHAKRCTYCMCVQICIISMCARAEGDGMLQDGRLRVADGLIPHIHFSYQGKEGKPFSADVSGERKTQKSRWCLHSLRGNFGGLSLTSVRVILTSVVPDSPPMWPPMSLAWMTTLYSWRASRSMFGKAVRIIPEWTNSFTSE